MDSSLAEPEVLKTKEKEKKQVEWFLVKVPDTPNQQGKILDVEKGEEDESLSWWCISFLNKTMCPLPFGKVSMDPPNT